MKWLFALLCVCLAPSLFAASARVVLKDGSQLEGDATLDARSGIILTNAQLGETNFDLSAIRSIRFHFANNTSEHSNIAGPFPTGWTNVDIGLAPISGSAKYQRDEWVLSSSGTRVWQALPDQFHFAFRSFKGNGQIVAQLTNSDAAIAGVMIRESLEPDAEFVLLAATPGAEGVIYRARRERRYRDLIRAEGDWTNRDDIHAPCWLKLIRRDKRFSAYASADDGVTWQIIYESPNDWDRVNFAGLFVVSNNTNQLSRATFSNVTLEDEVDLKSMATNKASRLQVTLNDGSILAVDEVSADITKARLTVGSSNFVTSVLSVSRIVYGVVPDRFSRELTKGRRGVLLKTGDFFEGDLAATDKYRVKVSSVLFGSRSFPLDRVLVIAVSDPVTGSAPLLVRTSDGSIVQAKSLSTGPNLLLIEEPRLGRWTVPLTNLVEIVQNPNRR